MRYRLNSYNDRNTTVIDEPGRRHFATEKGDDLLGGDGAAQAVGSSHGPRHVWADGHTVGITVDRDGSLLLHAPGRLFGVDARGVGTWQANWVYRKLAEKDLLLAPPHRKRFVSGEGFDYLGRRYRLLLVDDGTAVRLDRGQPQLPRTLRPTRGPRSSVGTEPEHDSGCPRLRPWGGLSVQFVGEG